MKLYWGVISVPKWRSEIKFLPLLVALWVFVLAKPTLAQVPTIDTILRQQVEIATPGAMSLDDYLMEVAQKADVNFLIDETEIPAGSQVQPYPEGAAATAGVNGPQAASWQPTLLNRLSDVAATQHLSQLRQNARLFLFWHEPDVQDLGRLIAQENASFSDLSPAAYSAVQNQLADYLERVHGWKSGQPQPDLQIRFADVPRELRTGLLKIVRAQVANSIEGRELSVVPRPVNDQPAQIATETISVKAPDAAWFSDEFWKNARIRGYSQPERGFGTASYLLVGGTASAQDHRVLFAPVGRLSAARR